MKRYLPLTVVLFTTLAAGAAWACSVVSESKGVAIWDSAEQISVFVATPGAMEWKRASAPFEEREAVLGFEADTTSYNVPHVWRAESSDRTVLALGGYDATIIDATSKDAAYRVSLHSGWLDGVAIAFDRGRPLALVRADEGLELFEGPASPTDDSNAWDRIAAGDNCYGPLALAVEASGNIVGMCGTLVLTVGADQKIEVSEYVHSDVVLDIAPALDDAGNAVFYQVGDNEIRRIRRDAEGKFIEETLANIADVTFAMADIEVSSAVSVAVAVLDEENYEWSGIAFKDDGAAEWSATPFAGQFAEHDPRPISAIGETPKVLTGSITLELHEVGDSGSYETRSLGVIGEVSEPGGFCSIGRLSESGPSPGFILLALVPAALVLRTRKRKVA